MTTRDSCESLEHDLEQDGARIELQINDSTDDLDVTDTGGTEVGDDTDDLIDDQAFDKLAGEDLMAESEIKFDTQDMNDILNSGNKIKLKFDNSTMSNKKKNSANFNINNNNNIGINIEDSDHSDRLQPLNSELDLLQRKVSEQLAKTYQEDHDNLDDHELLDEQSTNSSTRQRQGQGGPDDYEEIYRIDRPNTSHIQRREWTLDTNDPSSQISDMELINLMNLQQESSSKGDLSGSRSWKRDDEIDDQDDHDHDHESEITMEQITDLNNEIMTEEDDLNNMNNRTDLNDDQNHLDDHELGEHGALDEHEGREHDNGDHESNVMETQQDSEDTIETHGRAIMIVTHAKPGLQFEERCVQLQPDQTLRVGRLSTKQEVEAKDNLNFDCKVLSRRHAKVSFDYDEQQFFLEDTQSSNGTFINKCSESNQDKIHSDKAYPIYAGDKIWFGVVVKDSKNSSTHDCIICTVKMYYPDGKVFPTRPVSDLSGSLNRGITGDFTFPIGTNTRVGDGGKTGSSTIGGRSIGGSTSLITGAHPFIPGPGEKFPGVGGGSGGHGQGGNLWPYGQKPGMQDKPNQLNDFTDNDVHAANMVNFVVLQASEVYQLENNLVEAEERYIKLENQLFQFRERLKRLKSKSHQSWKSMVNEQRLLLKIDYLTCTIERLQDEKKILKTDKNSKNYDAFEKVQQVIEKCKLFEDKALDQINDLILEKSEFEQKLLDLQNQYDDKVESGANLEKKIATLNQNNIEHNSFLQEKLDTTLAEILEVQESKKQVEANLEAMRIEHDKQTDFKAEIKRQSDEHTKDIEDLNEKLIEKSKNLSTLNMKYVVLQSNCDRDVSALQIKSEECLRAKEVFNELNEKLVKLDDIYLQSERRVELLEFELVSKDKQEKKLREGFNKELSSLEEQLYKANLACEDAHKAVETLREEKAARIVLEALRDSKEVTEKEIEREEIKQSEQIAEKESSIEKSVNQENEHDYDDHEKSTHTSSERLPIEGNTEYLVTEELKIQGKIECSEKTEAIAVSKYQSDNVADDDQDQSNATTPTPAISTLNLIDQSVIFSRVVNLLKQNLPNFNSEIMILKEEQVNVPGQAEKESSSELSANLIMETKTEGKMKETDYKPKRRKSTSRTSNKSTENSFSESESGQVTPTVVDSALSVEDFCQRIFDRLDKEVCLCIQNSSPVEKPSRTFEKLTQVNIKSNSKSIATLTDSTPISDSLYLTPTKSDKSEKDDDSSRDAHSHRPRDQRKLSSNSQSSSSKDSPSPYSKRIESLETEKDQLSKKMGNIQKENANLASKISLIKTEASEQKRAAAIAASVNESLEAQVVKLSSHKSETDFENKKLQDNNQQCQNKIKQLEKSATNKDEKISGLNMTISRIEEDVKTQKDHYHNKITERERLLKIAESDKSWIIYGFLLLFLVFVISSDIFFCGTGTVVNWMNLSRLPNMMSRRC